MQKKNISSVAINSETLTAAAFASPPRDLWAEAKTGAHRIIFIGPETMRTAAYDGFISNRNVRARLAQFTVDELHAADEWGVEFRKEFQDISTMRARLPEHTVFVGLSATIEPGRQFGSCAKLMAFQPGFHLEKQDCERRNVALIVRPIKYTSSGLEFRDLDWTVPPNLTKASDVAKLLIFVQTIDGGHRLVLYLRTLLPLHLQKDAQRLIRHHHSLACPDCKAEGLDSLYKLDEDRDCLIHVSTDVLTVGVDIPGLAAVIIYGKMSSASTVQQQAGRPARERGSTGKAYLYVTKADMADAMAYVKSDAGKLDKRVLAAKDATSHVRVAEPSTAPAEDSTDGTGETVDTLLDATARSEVDNVPTSTTQSVTAAKKSKKTKKIIAAPGVIAKPGARTCSSLLLIFAASGRDLCVTRQINMVYGNPGVDKDCGRCSSCIGDTVPEPRAKPTHADGGETDIVDPAAEKVPAYMKPQTKDLKMVTEKLEQSARTIQWNQPRGPDALLVGARIFLPPRIISAITTDFLLITSEEIFKTRVRDWKYAEDYTQALWNVTKVLVDNLSKELKTRHEEALEKQRDARVHKYLVTNGLAGITGVRLVIPKAVPANAATDDSATTAAIPESVEPVNIRSEVPPKDFYAGSPTRTPPRSKRKAQESWEDTGSPKRRKTMDKENAAPGATTSAKKVKKSAPPAHKKSKSAPKKS
ncbi:P-loop containing nucleoside triphosphate hydrolase protein, partial [Mycena polygramma]